MEAGGLRQQPIRRHRHRVFAPLTVPKPMAEGDLVRFFKAIDSVRDRLIFLLMLRCGLRVSEAAALKPADIDWEERALLVRQGKGRKDRRVYLFLHSIHQRLAE